jgi:DNA-binding CsgD family transcriptional regulator
VRKLTVETPDDLTAQGEQIAGLAREGLSNPEIGARLSVSRRRSNGTEEGVHQARDQI